MTLPVYYCAGLARNHLTPGSSLSFEGAEAYHAATVKRTRPGELIDVVDGSGGRATMDVRSVEKTRVHGIVRSIREEPPHAIHITLVQALSKSGRDEQAIETATEYGVDALIPWQADRSIVKWNSPAKMARAQAKWETIALAAMKQSRRSWKPTIHPMLNSRELAVWIREQTQVGTKVYVCHEEATQRLVDHVPHLAHDDAVAIIVGPEGGITPEEVHAYEEAGACTVLLAEHVLRASSAGPWAIAVTRAYALL